MVKGFDCIKGSISQCASSTSMLADPFWYVQNRAKIVAEVICFLCSCKKANKHGKIK